MTQDMIDKIRKSTSLASSRFKELTLENYETADLIPLEMNEQLKIEDKLIHRKLYIDSILFQSIKYFLDPNRQGVIVSKLNICINWINEYYTRWYIIEESFIDETLYKSSDQIQAAQKYREEIAPYYEQNHIDAASIGLMHSAFEQNHPLYQQCFAMITAWNPNNEEHDAAFNKQANEQLKSAIGSRGLEAIDCVGWLDDHSENGFVIPNISFTQALALGRAFGQYSIFYNRPDRWGYYESAYGYPVFVTTTEIQNSKKFGLDMQKKDEERQRLREERLRNRKPKIWPLKQINILNEESYLTYDCEAQIEDLIERIYDPVDTLVALMARQRASKEAIDRAIKNNYERREKRLKSQGFENTAEKVLTLFGRKQGLSSPRVKAKDLLAVIRDHNQNIEVFNVKLNEIFKTFYEVESLESLENDMYEMLYAMRCILTLNM